jgi:hypothetical protein
MPNPDQRYLAVLILRMGQPLEMAKPLPAVYTISRGLHHNDPIGGEVFMSGTTAFLEEVRGLMERIPDNLTLQQLEWAFEETSLSLGSIIAARAAAAQHRKRVPRRKQTEKSPPR